MTPDKATALREAAEAVFSEICLIDACGQICVDGDSIERGVQKALEPLLAERERLRGALEAIRASIAHSVVKSPGPDTVKTAGGIVSGDIGAEVFAAFAAIENLARQALEATDG